MAKKEPDILNAIKEILSGSFIQYFGITSTDPKKAYDIAVKRGKTLLIDNNFSFGAFLFTNRVNVSLYNDKGELVIYMLRLVNDVNNINPSEIETFLIQCRRSITTLLHENGIEIQIEDTPQGNLIITILNPIEAYEE